MLYTLKLDKKVTNIPSSKKIINIEYIATMKNFLRSKICEQDLNEDGEGNSYVNNGYDKVCK